MPVNIFIIPSIKIELSRFPVLKYSSIHEKTVPNKTNRIAILLKYLKAFLYVKTVLFIISEPVIIINTGTAQKQLCCTIENVKF